jgi:hypothetical protein
MPTRKRKETPVQVLRRSIQRVDRLMRQVKRLDADRAAWYRRATMVHRGIGARARAAVRPGRRASGGAALTRAGRRSPSSRSGSLSTPWSYSTSTWSASSGTTRETYPTVPGRRGGARCGRVSHGTRS